MPWADLKQMLISCHKWTLLYVKKALYFTIKSTWEIKLLQILVAVIERTHRWFSEKVFCLALLHLEFNFMIII